MPGQSQNIAPLPEREARILDVPDVCLKNNDLLTALPTVAES